MAAGRDERIAVRAYAIWQEAGCPEGRAPAHWLQAETEIVKEDGKESAEGVTREKMVDREKSQWRETHTG